MLTKLFLIIIIFLEMLGIPKAQEKLEKWVYSVFKRPVVQIQKEPDVGNLNRIDLAKVNPWLVKKRQAREPVLTAEGIVVLDLDSSEILYQKNPDQQFSIASLTKIMTAIVALENYNQTDVITTPKEATNLLPGSVIYLQEGEEMTVLNLLYGLLLYSGNDAAYTLASKIGQDKFVSLMNQKAKALGFSKTYFVEPSGLEQGNVSTPREIAFLMGYALRNPVFAKIVKTDQTEIVSTGGQIRHPLKNTNQLLREYTGTYGGKTGYTEQAGHSLVVAVERGGHEIISVVLKASQDQFKETKSLLDWVFLVYF